MTHSDETGRLPLERTAAARAPADSDGRRGLLLVLALLTAVGPLATAVRHALGNESGGGYEWAATHDPVPHGITAPALDAWGRIGRPTAVWNGAYADTAMFTALAQNAIEH
jgi:hypothetical protein